MTQASNASETSSEGSPPPRRRRWRWVVGALGALVVVALGVVVVLFLVREDPGAKPVGEAVEEFRQGDGQQDAAPEIHRPDAGVYEATGEGNAALSFPPLSQHDGPTIPVTVQHEPDGCWTLKLDYNQAHWQTWHFCPGDEPGSVAERGGQTHQRWDLGTTSIGNVSTFVCDPPVVALVPGAEVGATWQQSCDGTNTQTPGSTTSAGLYRLAALETLTIGDQDVPTHHYREERTISGSQTGSQTTDLWIAIATGLPVRSTRSIRIDSDSPIGTITYTEAGSWQLNSLHTTT